MKRIYLIAFILSATLAFTSSCKKESSRTITGSAVKNIDESLKIWAAYKQDINNSYTYTVVKYSFSGYYTETKITVINGNVTQRDYFYYQRDMASSSDAKLLLSEWHESGEALGSHVNEGAAALDLDAIYAQAKNVWLKADTKTNDVYFETDSKGILSSAGYMLKGCADDCFIGINITSVAALQ